ncbi:MAG: pro-sigmaK processing inhibitor BofA family protein [bacterium]
MNIEPVIAEAAEKLQELTLMDNIGSGVILVAVIVLAVFILTKPLRKLVKLGINTALGYVTLAVVNYLGSFIGVQIGVNLLNAIIVGILGVPGVAVLFFVRWMALV